MSTMSDWIAAVCAELELELADQGATTTAVLDLTADVAHGVARPAAPVTAFLVGLAAGRASATGGGTPDAEVAALCERLGARAKAWESEHSS
ncbi:MAG TPA: DUF6457 domain-containing protein [Pseudonocardia sp.]|nr:DUF6457 domain-containing protein [Pseudonocardia sp.]